MENKDTFVHSLKEIIAEIPYGRVATIEELTQALDLPLEREDEVAWALKEVNDITIPSWRVVRDNGTLIDNTEAGELEDQKFLLEKEGISFTEDNRINISEHFWSAIEYLEGLNT